MMLNVAVGPGLYYAADSAVTLEVLKRPSAAEPVKAGDTVVVPKQKDLVKGQGKCTHPMGIYFGKSRCRDFSATSRNKLGFQK